MPRTRWTATLVAVSLLLTACATTATPGASPTPSPTPSPVSTAADLSGVTWLLDDLGGKPPVAETFPSAAFAEDGTIAGTGGCNRYRGSYTVSGSTIKIDEALASTMMACEETVMAQEAAFFDALVKARAFSVEGEKLILSDDAGKTLAVFTAQSQSLAGTKWQVQAYNNGKSAVVSVLEGTTPSVEFSEDGKVSGSGGCNTIAGSFTTKDGDIKIGPLASTMMACSEPEGIMEQEAALLAALESAATYSIEGPRLEMRTADDATAVQLVRS